MAAQDRKGPKKNPDEKPPKYPASDIARLVQAVFDMKSEMGIIRQALINSGISIEKSPIVQKQKEQFTNGKQKKSFAGAAKKNKMGKFAQRSLVQIPNGTTLSDSDDECDQPEYGGNVGMMAIVAKPKKHVSPRLINAMMVGLTRRNSESRRISECDAYQDQSWGNDEVEAQMMTDESMQQENLFAEPDVQKALELRDVMSQQGDAHEYQTTEEPMIELGTTVMMVLRTMMTSIAKQSNQNAVLWMRLSELARGRCGLGARHNGP